MQKIIDIAQYVREGIKDNTLFPETYTKVAVVKATKGVEGQKVKTVMKDGLVETFNIVTVDENTGEPDWIVVNPSGEEYVVKDSVFCEKYSTTNSPGVYQAKGKPVTCVKVAEDISFVAPWGGEMFLKAGGMLVLAGENDIYGVQNKEFQETYQKYEDL